MDNAAARLETLYRDIGPGLLTYLRRRFRDAHAAEDLLHETFFQAARRLERLAEAASARAWLFTIAHNVAVTALRRRRIAVPLPADLPTHDAAADPRLERVQAALTKLPDLQREALELRLRDELTYEEIAEVLNIPVGTVRSRLHNAVQRLRDAVAVDES